MTSATAFKHAMRHVPTGVTIVTSLKDGEPRGLTLNSFASVSVDPPALLVCVNREARSYLYISSSRIFCVNVLAGEQRHLAERFAGKVREKQFEEIGYDVDVTGRSGAVRRDRSLRLRSRPRNITSDRTRSLSETSFRAGRAADRRSGTSTAAITTSASASTEAA